MTTDQMNIADYAAANQPEAIQPERITINGAVYVRVDVAENEECAKQECTYYSHYLLYHDPALNGSLLGHASYHFAEKRCEEAQKRLMEWMDAHMDDRAPVPEHLEKMAERWERKVCA